MQQLSAMDATFVLGESHSLPMHFASVAIYDQSTTPNGHVRFKDILNLFQDAMHEVPLFTRRLVEVPLSLDQPYWIEDPNFDIEFHVRHISLPKPGDWRQFHIQLARLHSRAMDRSRPLWEVTVIEGLDNLEGIPAGSFAVMTKIHHAAMDGVAAAKLFTTIHDFEAEAKHEFSNSDKPFITEETPSKLDLLLRSSLNTARRTGKIVSGVKTAAKGISAVNKAVKAGELEAPKSTPKTRFNDVPSPYRVITSLQLSLSETQAARKKIGVTLNEFMLAVFSGAMRQYLEAKDELPGDSLVAQAPVNLRISDSDGADGNQITTINIPLCSEIADAKERLLAIQKASKNAKQYAQTIGPNLLPELSQIMPPWLIKSVLKVRHGESTPRLKALLPSAPTSIITNVPGSPIPYYLLGAKAVGGLALGPIMPGTGLFQSVVSHEDMLMVTAVSCREIMPDPEFYQQCLSDSYRETLAACNAK